MTDPRSSPTLTDAELLDAERDHAALNLKPRLLRDALEAMYRMHVRESGHKNGECANCFMALSALAETSHAGAAMHGEAGKSQATSADGNHEP